MRYRGLADRYSLLSVLSPVGIYMVDIEGNMTCKEGVLERVIVC